MAAHKKSHPKQPQETRINFMRYVLSSDVFSEEHCKTLIQKSAKKKTELILASIRGSCIESDQRFKMNEASAHMDYLEQAILRTEVELYTRIQPYYHLVEHLSNQLPGISQLSAALIISEIGVDMSVFESDKHLNSWAGLAPANNESAGKKKSVRISTQLTQSPDVFWWYKRRTHHIKLEKVGNPLGILLVGFLALDSPDVFRVGK